MAEEKKNLGFEIYPTKYMVYSKYNPATRMWEGLTIRLADDKSFWPSPMSAGLNYGRSVFEGMKAFRHEISKKIFLFRPKDHAKRFNRSLAGLFMPEFPELEFLRALHLLVRNNAEFVPEYREGSLYIRPIAYANDRLGFADHPDLSYACAFWCTPVGNYYTEGLKPISVYIAKNITRAMPGGIGSYKAAGNYAISMIAQKTAKEKECRDALFLDGPTKKHIEELGAANVFIVQKDALYTPRLGDTILPGITRKSIMTLAKSELNLKVEEKDISVKELVKADEIFATGTAAVVTPIGKIKNGNKEYTIGSGEVGQNTKKLYDLLTGIQYGDRRDKFGWLEKVIL